ncbi:hypothetical protein [Mesorhizobium sp. M0870]|uniref:hypothetical protein n=1 Tax=Mesorhizobium sp. M0870 TaxID=2957016 RepID=UPI00333CCBBF
MQMNVFPPEIERLSTQRIGRNAIWRISLADAGTMTLPAKEILRYRKFHGRCMERLLTVFAHVESSRWAYQLLLALCQTAANEAEQQPGDE